MSCPRTARARRGARNHLSGQAAEEAVLAHLVGLGWYPLARRWRGPGGEIDLILRHRATLIAVEVKAGPDHAGLADRLRPAQLARIAASAEAYLLDHGAPGDDLRIDLALVDSLGRVAMVENITLM